MLSKNRVVWHFEKTEWFDQEIHHILSLWLPVRKSTSQTFFCDCLSENPLVKSFQVCTTELQHFSLFRLLKLWLLHCYFGIGTTIKPPMDILSKCFTFNSLQFLQLNHSRNNFQKFLLYWKYLHFSTLPSFILLKHKKIQWKIFISICAFSKCLTLWCLILHIFLECDWSHPLLHTKRKKTWLVFLFW